MKALLLVMLSLSAPAAFGQKLHCFVGDGETVNSEMTCDPFTNGCGFIAQEADVNGTITNTWTQQFTMAGEQIRLTYGKNGVSNFVLLTPGTQATYQFPSETIVYTIMCQLE